MDFKDWLLKEHGRSGVDRDTSISELMEQAFDAGIEEMKERAADHVRGIGLVRNEDGGAEGDLAREIEAL